MTRTLPTPSFARALKLARTAAGLSQEDFHPTSGRTYVSALERGVKQPTLGKVDDLCAVIGVHPLTLLTLTYSAGGSPADVKALLKRIESEVLAVLHATDE